MENQSNFLSVRKNSKETEIRNLMNETLIQSDLKFNFDELVKELEQSSYDKNYPLCKKEKKSQWFIADNPWWLVEDIDPHGAELCILACYRDHRNISKFKMEVLEYALRKIANQYLRIPYTIDRVAPSAKGRSGFQAYGGHLSVRQQKKK